MRFGRGGARIGRRVILFNRGEVSASSFLWLSWQLEQSVEASTSRLSVRPIQVVSSLSKSLLGGDVECSRDLTDSSHSLISLISLTHLTHSTDSLVTEGNKFREIDKSAPQQNGIRVIDLVV